MLPDGHAVSGAIPVAKQRWGNSEKCCDGGGPAPFRGRVVAFNVFACKRCDLASRRASTF